MRNIVLGSKGKKDQPSGKRENAADIQEGKSHQCLFFPSYFDVEVFCRQKSCSICKCKSNKHMNWSVHLILVEAPSRGSVRNTIQQVVSFYY